MKTRDMERKEMADFAPGFDIPSRLYQNVRKTLCAPLNRRAGMEMATDDVVPRRGEQTRCCPGEGRSLRLTLKDWVDSATSRVVCIACFVREADCWSQENGSCLPGCRFLLRANRPENSFFLVQSNL